MTYRLSTWTSEREQLLEAKWLAGEKVELIAIELGINSDLVKKKRKRLGLPPRQFKGGRG